MTDSTSFRGLPVAGYQPQSEAKVALVNKHKTAEELILRICDQLKACSPDTVDQRWLAIGRTDIERGFMALNRAVFQPQRISLPEDEPTIDEVLERADIP